MASLDETRDRESIKIGENHDIGTTLSPINSGGADVEQQVVGLETLAAIKSIWNIPSLIIAWIGALLIAFALSFDKQTVYAFQPYATSSFGAASLLGTIAIVQNVVASVMQQPLAKLADVYGRFELWTVCIVIVTIGEIMLATSQTISTYAGAQVFFIVGVLGLDLMLQLLAGDSSDLRNRAIMNVIPFAPAILTTWTSSFVTSAILDNETWRWGYGIFAIMFPICAIPLLATLYFNQQKATKIRKAEGTYIPHDHFLIFQQLDPIGLVFFSAGLALFLIPVTLAASSPDSWRSAHIIAMIVVGIVCLIVFVAWEIKWAKWPLLSVHLMKNRTVMVGMIASLLDYAALNSYVAYFFTYLVVACNQSVKAATNISIILSFTAVFGQLGAGVIAKYIGRYKWITCFGIGFKVLGIGLMLRYRDAHTYLPQLVVAQVIIGAGEGIMNTVQAGMQAAVGEESMAAVTALLITACGVGAAVGGAISGGVWTNLLPQNLAANLPGNLQGELANIESSIVVALGYAFGSPERDAINKSYDDTFRILLIVAVGLESVSLLSSFMLKDFDLRAVDKIREYGGMVIGKTGAADALKGKIRTTASPSANKAVEAEEVQI